MAKKTVFERAIESMEADQAVLQAAIDRLRQQQATSTTARVVRMPPGPATEPTAHSLRKDDSLTRLVVALVVALVGVAACSQDSLTNPSAVSTEHRGTAYALAPIAVPDGVSCPHDAPLVRVSTHEGSLDVEWSQIPRVQGYQVEIQRYEVINAYATWAVLEIAAHDEAASVRPGVGRYRARVRSRVCGEFGNWSASVQGAIDAPPAPKVPAPLPTPDDCAVSLQHAEPPTSCGGR